MQLFMWSAIGDLKITIGEVDYLQVFTILKVNKSENKVMIIHSQEKPRYRYLELKAIVIMKRYL